MPPVLALHSTTTKKRKRGPSQQTTVRVHSEVNPERPWPDLELLKEVTEDRGFVLAPRLTVHPEYALDRDRWLDTDNHFPVLDRSDAEGLGRDDPGSQMPEKTMENRDAGSGADVLVADENSTQWYSGGATHSPMTLVPSRSSARYRPHRRHSTWGRCP